MFYQLEEFGKRLRSIRKALNLTQTDVRDYVGLNEDTLRKIENGTSMPKVETLDLLSIAYKQNIYNLFDNYKLTFDNYFEERISSILLHIRTFDYKSIKIEVEDFYRTFSSNDSLKSDILRTKMNQYRVYLNALYNFETIAIDKTRNDLTALIEVIGISQHDLNDDRYVNLDKLEIRIFTLISVIFRQRKEFVNSIKYIRCALNSLEIKYSNEKDFLYFYLILSYNLMTLYHRIEAYDEIEKLYMRNLDILDDQLSITTLSSYFIRVGINKYHINSQSYNNFVNFGLYLLKHFGYNDKYQRYKDLFDSMYPFINIE